MTYPTQDRPALHILGITTTTSSERASRDIAALWERAARLQIFDGPEALAVYHHYAFPAGGEPFPTTSWSAGPRLPTQKSRAASRA